MRESHPLQALHIYFKYRHIINITFIKRTKLQIHLIQKKRIEKRIQDLLNTQNHTFLESNLYCISKQTNKVKTLNAFVKSLNGIKHLYTRYFRLLQHNNRHFSILQVEMGCCSPTLRCRLICWTLLSENLA